MLFDRPHHRLTVTSCLILLALPSFASAGKPKEQPKTSAPTGADASQPSEDESPLEVAPEEHHGAFDLKYKYLTGDWGGTRSHLEDLGIKFKIDFMNQLLVNMYGGKETKNGHDTAGSYEFNVYLDMKKLLDIDGATFWIRAKGTWGGDDSDFDKEKIGAFFKTNQDASAEEVVFVDKWHWRQFLFDKKLELRLGRQEPVKDLFDTSKIIGHEDKYFLNRALVRNATIPSKKGLGLFAKWKFTKHAYVSVAALDANAKDRQTNFNTAFHGPDEFRFFTELGYDPKIESSKGALSGHYRIGTWFDPTRRKKFRNTFGGLRAEQFESGDFGLFLGFDQMVWKENDDPKDKQGISVAGRYGHANGEVRKIEDFWAVAGQYRGLIPGRDEDLFGFGVGQGIFADEYRRVRPRADRETVYEMYYSIKLAPWLFISPDLQYITNAGGDSDDRDAFVGGIRIRMNL